MTLLDKIIERLIPVRAKTRLRLRDEPANQLTSATVTSIQSALRAAEYGDTRNLFTLYRDILAGGSHVQAELSKRKLALLAQPASVQPAIKDDAPSEQAAQAVEQMIASCGNWLDGLTYLLDSCLWPVAIVEKIFAPADEPYGEGLRLRYKLDRLEPVNHTLLCFRERIPSARTSVAPTATPAPEPWESGIRLYKTDEATGSLSYVDTEAYHLDPMRHVVHRGHLLVGQRDCFGGPMRSLLFWWYLSAMLRDWWARATERFGAPFPVGHTDTASTEAVTLLQNAFSESLRIGGLVVDHETQVELIQAAMTGAADNFERFHIACRHEISELILGQTMSSEAQASGLGSGNAKLHSDVREDFRMFDQIKLAETLRTQVFAPFLRINGIAAPAPKIVWGGLSDEDAATFTKMLLDLSNAGFEPTDEAVPVLQERVGIELQRKEAAEPAMALSPFNLSRFTAPPADPTDRIAAAKSAALAEAFRGSLAPVRQLVLSSHSPEELERSLRLFYTDWKPARIQAVVEEALQLAAAAGASAAQR